MPALLAMVILFQALLFGVHEMMAWASDTLG
jgi:hypothetical protein